MRSVKILTFNSNLIIQFSYNGYVSCDYPNVIEANPIFPIELYRWNNVVCIVNLPTFKSLKLYFNELSQIYTSKTTTVADMSFLVKFKI